jgi:hypothetical protein
MRLNASKLFFMVSLCLAAFGYGVGTVQYRLFPFDVLQDANRAWQALTTTALDKEEKSDDGYAASLRESTVRQYSELAGNELIFVAGGEDYLEEHSAGNGCLAWIMDRRGKVRHVWHYDPELFAELKKVATVPGKSPRIYPVGMHLYADGGVLACFHGSPTFPYGIGLARFDRDSKLIWKRELHNHHWFSVAADGRIYALTMRAVDSPQAVGRTRYSIASGDGKILQEAVMILDADGNVLDEIPILEAVIESGWSGLLATAGVTEARDDDHYVISGGDPTHANDVQLVDSELAAAHPWLSPGDLLLSLRNLNALGILDPQTRRFKWMSAGATVMQHSPRFYENGVLVFDSLGGVIKKSLRGSGLFTVPGLMKLKVVKKPATKSREGVNPFTGEKMTFKAKPASKKVRALPLKSLKGFVN